MKLAALVLCYQAAPVLARSLPLLQTAGFDIFLHIDAKVNQDDFLQALGTTEAPCHLVDERIDIFWGGYSMMLAGLRLLETARNAGPYDRYLLLSDDSFPVYPPKELLPRLKQETDLITMIRQSEGSRYHDRYYKFFFYDHPATMERGHGQQSLEIDEAFERHIAEIAALRRIGKKKIDVYFGSQFWCLTAPTADYLLHTVATDVHLTKSFEYAALPDELMAQSIIGQRFGESRITGPVFEDFPKGKGPTVFSAIDQLPYLPPHALFVRKIAPAATDFSALLADRLMRNLTIFGYPPNLPHFETLFVEETGRAVVNLRLSAPETRRQGWHNRETYLGRDFRWSSSEILNWDFYLPEHSDPIDLCIFLPLVIEARPHIFEHCYVQVGGIKQRMQHGRGGLSARITYEGDRHLTVTVTTPLPVSPKDNDPYSEDDRHIGLSIAV